MSDSLKSSASGDGPSRGDAESYEAVFGEPLVEDVDANAAPAAYVPDAPQEAAPTVPAKTRRSAVRELVETLLLAALIFFVVRAVILNFRVDGNSMLPNLHNGELVLVNHQAYASYDVAEVVDWIPGLDVSWVVTPFGEPERGDIIVFNPPDDDKPYIKRVVGLPGDVIEFSQGFVILNGQQLTEPYIQDGITRCPGGICDEPITIPEGHVFVLGDNRRNSEDSRYFGPITIGSIIGKATLVYWPISAFGTVPHEEYSLLPVD